MDSMILYKARVLSTKVETIIYHNSLTPILPMASIFNKFKEVDLKRIQNSISSDDLKRL